MNADSLLNPRLLETANFSLASNPPLSIKNDKLSGENFDPDNLNPMWADIQKRKSANTQTDVFSLSDYSKAKPP
ncbi:MAG: hypothetical protein VXZ32_07560 [Verrucomicrobiota bacterium]|nr:hypothetical protein [Verrucomicrobiota bacterium]